MGFCPAEVVLQYDTTHKITHHTQTKYSYTNSKGHITHNEYNAKKEQSCSCNSPWRPIWLWDVQDPRCLDSRLTDGGKVVSLTRRQRFTRRNLLLVISARSWVALHPRKQSFCRQWILFHGLYSFTERETRTLGLPCRLCVCVSFLVNFAALEASLWPVFYSHVIVNNMTDTGRLGGIDTSATNRWT
jgi:hypothetical protein